MRYTLAALLAIPALLAAQTPDAATLAALPEFSEVELPRQHAVGDIMTQRPRTATPSAQRASVERRVRGLVRARYIPA